MKVTKVTAGEYKVVTEAGTFTVGRLYNSVTDQPYAWEVWGGYPATTENCWCHTFRTKRSALDAIDEHIDWANKQRDQEEKQSHYPNAPEGSIWDY